MISHLLCAKPSSNFWDTNEEAVAVFLMGGGKDKHMNKRVLNEICVCAFLLYQLAGSVVTC